MAHCHHHPGHTPPPAPTQASRYTCPMHPKVVQSGPGDCPICGMALEPVGVSADGTDNAELRDLTRRLVIAAILTLPVFILGMAHLLHGFAIAAWADTVAARWLQAAAATVVLFWCGWPFLRRGRVPVQDLADRVAAIFIPIVVIAALLAFFAWLVFAGSLPMAVTAAVSVLIIACPCAIGLAVPMSIMVGVGRAAQSGVLVRQPAALERLEKIDTLCLDKTGTLTEGSPEVSDLLCAPGTDRPSLLALSRALEEHSEHPLAAAIVRQAEAEGISALPDTSDFQSTPGGGVSGTVDGKIVRIGTPRFAGTSQDEIHDAAADVAAQLHLADFRASQSPGDKAAAIREWQASGRRVGMTGDGVNDAPALAVADTSIAMGPGSDVAKQTADFILVHGSLDGIVRTFALGRAIMRNIRQNLFLAFTYHTLGIPLAASALYPLTGWLLSPMIAGAAMSFSSVSVINNALRLGRSRV